MEVKKGVKYQLWPLFVTVDSLDQISLGQISLTLLFHAFLFDTEDNQHFEMPVTQWNQYWAQVYLNNARDNISGFYLIKHYTFP